MSTNSQLIWKCSFALREHIRVKHVEWVRQRCGKHKGDWDCKQSWDVCQIGMHARTHAWAEGCAADLPASCHHTDAATPWVVQCCQTDATALRARCWRAVATRVANTNVQASTDAHQQPKRRFVLFCLFCRQPGAQTSPPTPPSHSLFPLMGWVIRGLQTPGGLVTTAAWMPPLSNSSSVNRIKTNQRGSYYSFLRITTSSAIHLLQRRTLFFCADHPWCNNISYHMHAKQSYIQI